MKKKAEADCKIKCPLRINYGPLRINYSPLCINYSPLRINYGPLRIYCGPLSINYGPLAKFCVQKHIKRSNFLPLTPQINMLKSDIPDMIPEKKTFYWLKTL